MKKTEPGGLIVFSKVVVILIKPSSYDDQGFPHRYLRGVLPSNSLAALYSLTNEALDEVLPGDVSREIHVCEDGIKGHAKRLERLAERFPEEGTKLIVGLVAVQTSQFPRARDLIHRWQRLGATCVIGGFHVSGSIATMYDGINDPHRPGIPCPHKMPEEIQELMDEGTIVFHGEAEEVWRETLADILAGHPQSLYRGGLPNFENAPLPEYPKGYFEKSFATPIGTFDTGRGCPFACSFCTIINVQGRNPRYRDPSAIVEEVEAICRREGKALFFFTDDNFARSPGWRPLLEGLVALREKECDINFMIEADLACHKIKDFLSLLAKAGCSQIFMGVESMNPKNLTDANKPQNRVEQYRKLWKQCHEHGIAVHAGYIIGFPHDTPESVAEDVRQMFEVGVDQASYFMFTCIPGSEDHARAVAAGVEVDADFSRYDSFHTVTDHPLMTREEWFESYTSAWRSFYSMANMIAALKRFKSRKARLNLLNNYIWYRWSFATEGTHPMIAGFYRYRDWKERRPDAPPLKYSTYLLQEVWRHIRYIGRFFAEFYRFQHVVFETEYAPILAEKRDELTGRVRGVGDWARRTFGSVMTRQWLNRFWIDYARNRWNLLFNPLAYRWHLYMLPYAFTEVVYTFRFAIQLRHLVRASTS